jgi:cell division protein FtsI (penicillin-binding protein 3)
LNNGASSTVTSALFIGTNNMPSLEGLGLKDALNVCENMGLKVRIKGRGKVKHQSIIVGQTVTKGQEISIELSQYN